MTHSRPAARTPLLALASVGFIASLGATAAIAQTPEEDKATELQGVTVTDTAIDEEVKVERVESPKATRPLLDTPQTITVIGNQTIRQQNLLTLRDALQTIPGITFGAGEGGGGYGDSINLRGYSANNDITIDGVRDSAQYSRTETFNIQQIEVYNGANSVFNGSGSVGGTINLVQKTPQASDLTVVQAGVGTDDYWRGTVDSNMRVSDLVGFRPNAVYHRNDVPGRDVERFRRWGVAPSVAIGVDGPTKLVLSYVHQRDNNVPVYGVPYYRNALYGGALPGVSRSGYFGIEGVDDQDIVFDQATVRFSHDFSDKVTIRNLTRWQRVEQNSTTSAPQGTFCLAGTNRTPTGGACTASFTAPVIYQGTLRPATTAAPFVVTVPAGSFLPTGPRGLVRDQINDLYYNQTDLRAVFETGGLEHTVNLGVSFAQEDYSLDTGNLLRTAAGVPVQQDPINLANPVSGYAGPINYIRSTQSRGRSQNVAVYLFDTTKIVEQLELNFGLRYEDYRARFRSFAYGTSGATLGQVTAGSPQDNDEQLFSYRVGLNFKPVETVSLYASYGNSRVPASATVRLGCGTLITGGTGGAQDPCDVGAEKAVNYEIGAKADLFDRRLQLTAAVFRNERKNFRVATNDPIVTTLPVLDGRARVDGIALGASGNITDAWAVFANYTYLDSKIRQSVSDFCLANPGPRTSGTTVTNPCGNSAAVPDPQRGAELAQVPHHSGSLFTTYTLPFGLQLGYGLTYQGSFALNTPALTATAPVPAATLTPVFRSENYLIHRAFLSYPITGGLTAQVNVQNFTNKRYYTGIRNNGWAVPGDRRQAVFSLAYSF